MGPSFNEQFDQLGEWRKGFANQLAQFRSWLGEHELLDAAVQEHLHRLEAQLLMTRCAWPLSPSSPGASRS